MGGGGGGCNLSPSGLSQFHTSNEVSTYAEAATVPQSLLCNTVVQRRRSLLSEMFLGWCERVVNFCQIWTSESSLISQMRVKHVRHRTLLANTIIHSLLHLTPFCSQNKTKNIMLWKMSFTHLYTETTLHIHGTHVWLRVPRLRVSADSQAHTWGSAETLSRRETRSSARNT